MPALTVSELKSETNPTWCPGCGDFAVLQALSKAIVDLKLDTDNTLIVSGIGCSSNLPHFLRTYGFHSIHGRSLPVAQGAKLANPELTVVAAGGDGDGYGIGMGHFVHSVRRNVDLTYIVMDNQIYGLTTGQTSPTSETGHKTKSTPEGNIERPVNPISIALAAGATYVARGFSGDPNSLAELIKGAIQHKGFALVDVFSPCVTYNKNNTYAWFRENVTKVAHDPGDWDAAMIESRRWGAKNIPYGLFYRKEGTPTYEEQDVVLGRGVVPVKAKLGLAPEQVQEIVKGFY